MCHLFSTYHSNPIQHESASPLDVPNQNRQKKRLAPLEMNPPWLVPPAAAANHTVRQLQSLLSTRPTDACLAAPADRWILQVTSQHREACLDTWLFFRASRLPKFCIHYASGRAWRSAQRRRRERSGGTVVDCGALRGARALRGWKNNSVVIKHKGAAVHWGEREEEGKSLLRSKT